MVLALGATPIRVWATSPTDVACLPQPRTSRSILGPPAVEHNFEVYFDDTGTDREHDDWVIAALDVTPVSSTLGELA